MSIKIAGKNSETEENMVVDVSPLLRGEVKKIDIDYTLSPEQIDSVSFEEPCEGEERV